MVQINIDQAKTQLSKLVEEAAQGEEIIIAKAGRPIARLVPLATNESKLRTPGGMKGQIWLAEDFDAPMSDEELALWHDSAKLTANLQDIIQQLSENNFQHLHIHANHLLTPGMLPPYHQDPFDRMIISQASHEPMHLLTHDKHLSNYSELVMLV